MENSSFKKFLVWLQYKKIIIILFVATLIYYLNHFFSSFILKKEIKNRHDHFVPQFILRNFGIQNNNLIYVYERGRNKPFLTLPKSIANQIGFYTTKNKWTKRKDDYLDRIIYKVLEDKASKIVKKIIKTRSLALSILEESVLASFFAHLYTRTPAFRAQIKNFLLYLIENKKIAISDLGDRTFLKKIFEDNFLKVSRKQLIKYNYSKTRKLIDIENAENHIIISSVLIAEKIVKEIYYKKIHLLEINNRKDFFITSDNPIIILNFKKIPIFPTGWNLKDTNIAVCSPISNNLCIIYDNVGATRDSRIIDNKLLPLLRLINYNIMFYAERFVFSSENSNQIQNSFNKINRQFRYK